MKLEDVQKAIKEGKAEFVPQPVEAEPPKPEFDESAKYTAVLDMLRRPKYHITTAPDFTPKNFLEQIQFFDDGADQRLYLYVNGAWYYTALT